MASPFGIYPEMVRPLRRVEYDRLVEAGLFEDERVELIDGMLVTMSPQGALHADVVTRLAQLFFDAVRKRAQVRVQSPFAAGDDNEPEPDIALVQAGDYSRAHPKQAFLIVEVSDSSLSKDRLSKTRIYARAGVPEYWIVDLATRAIEVHTEPSAVGYGKVVKLGSATIVSPTAFPDIVVPIEEIIPALG